MSQITGQSDNGQGTNIQAIIGQDVIQGLEAPLPLGQLPQDISEKEGQGIQEELNNILNLITTVNDIRAQTIRLGLNPSLRFAIETQVIPVLNILTALSTSADFFSVSAYNMANINNAKTHEIKKTLELIYEITDLSEDVFEVLKKLVLSTLPKSP